MPIILKNTVIAISMNANHLLRYLLVSPSLRWGSSFILVIATYASAVWFTLNWASSSVVTDIKPMAATMIDLAPMPVAPETPPNAAPLGPIQEETPPPEPTPKPEPELKPLPELPVIKKAELVLPKEPPPELIKEEPEPIEEQMAQEDSAPPTFEAPPDDITAAPMDGAVSLTPSQALTTWQSKLLGHLERHKREGRYRQKTITYVRVKINRDGTLVDYSLEKPSAYQALNQEALALIVRAQPLPPPPIEIAGETIEFVVPVEFF